MRLKALRKTESLTLPLEIERFREYKCHMLFIRDKTLKYDFIIMMNKLICFHQTILAPYLQALKRAPDDDSLKRIQKLHILITQNSEKRETLAKLLSQGVIGSVVYNKGLNELFLQYDTYQKEMNALKHSSPTV